MSNENINKIADFFGVNTIFKRSRMRQYVDARMIYVKYEIDFEGRTLQSVANDFGCTHATILHSYNKFPMLYKHNKSIRYIWDLISTDNVLGIDLDLTESQIKHVRSISNNILKAKDKDLLGFIDEKIAIMLQAKLNQLYV